MTLSSMIVGSLSVSAAVSKPKLTSAKATSSSAITIKWKKVKKVKGYIVYRKTKGKSFSKIATVSSKKTSYTSKKLNPSTKYTFAIKAYKKSGSKKVFSSYSNSKSARTKAAYKLSKTSVTLKSYNATASVYIKGLNKNDYYSNISWSSSNTDVAYAYGFGSSVCKITAYKSGTCVVKAKYAGKTYSCKVYVKMPASRCTLSKPSMPKSYSDIYNNYYGESEIQSTMKITSLKHKFEDSYDGTVILKVDVAGKKTYDVDGSSGNNSCVATYKLKNSSGVIVDTGTIYITSMKVATNFLRKKKYGFRVYLRMIINSSLKTEFGDTKICNI